MVFASFSRRARNASRCRFRSRLSVLAFMTKAMASPMTPRTTAAIQATIPEHRYISASFNTTASSCSVSDMAAGM